jgi:hypothetical protein
VSDFARAPDLVAPAGNTVDVRDVHADDERIGVSGSRLENSLSPRIECGRAPASFTAAPERNFAAAVDRRGAKEILGDAAPDMSSSRDQTNFLHGATGLFRTPKRLVRSPTRFRRSGIPCGLTPRLLPDRVESPRSLFTRRLRAVPPASSVGHHDSRPGPTTRNSCISVASTAPVGVQILTVETSRFSPLTACFTWNTTAPRQPSETPLNPCFPWASRASDGYNARPQERVTSCPQTTSTIPAKSRS